MQFIDLKTQFDRVENQIMGRITKVLKSGAFVMGPEVAELEACLAEFVGVKHALGVSSGTDALLIALMALEVGPGDEVITTPFSFFATAEVILLLGAKPVFVDINPKTYNMDASGLEAAITPKTKVIMPVSLYGQCADLTAINAVAARYHLPVVEDAAQSFGATHHGHKSCSLTTIACTSFFPSKPLGCYGDGGACFTQNTHLAQRMEEIRNHGQSKRYIHSRLGINGRLDTLQAAILLEKIQLFTNEILMRQDVALRYAERLPQQLIKPFIEPHHTSVYAQYTIQVPNREHVQQILQEQGIPTAVHYPLGLHRQEAVLQGAQSEFKYHPYTDYASQVVMSLPMHPYLTEQDQDKICDAVVAALVEYELA